MIESGNRLSKVIFIGVFKETHLVATLSFRVPMPDHIWVKHIGEFGMSVLKEHWGQGIGKKLLLVMEKFAISIGVERIEAKVRTENERGIFLYQNAGYVIEGLRKKGAFIKGRYQDDYFIAKFLKPEKRDEELLGKIKYQDEKFNLVMRTVDESDAEQIHNAVIKSLDNLYPFLDWSHRELSVKNQIHRIHKSKENSRKKKSFDFSVFDGPTGDFLLSASLHLSRVPNAQCYGIGYWTSSEYCNKGFATLVTKILVVIAFDFLECDRVEIACNKANSASTRVIEKCGFNYEGEAKNYFPKPTLSMLEKGYSPERTGLQYSLTKESLIPWFDEVKKSISFKDS